MLQTGFGIDPIHVLGFYECALLLVEILHHLAVSSRPNCLVYQPKKP
jgi:hypothetical protein